MSRRRFEAGAAHASSFSLRSAINHEPVGSMQVAAFTSIVSRKPIGSPPPVPNGTGAGLSFKFSGPLTTAPASPVPMAPFSSPSKSPTAQSIPALSAGFLGSSNHHSKAQSGELLRLSAACDDLRTRLKTQTDKSTQLEGQLQRAGAMLTKERGEYQNAVSAMRNEMTQVRDSELKIRSELASRPTVNEFKQDRFQNAVRTAIEVEETNARVADAEARYAVLSKRSEAVQAELKILEKSREETLEIAAANATALFTNDQIAEKVAMLATTETSITAAQERVSVLEADVAKHTALRDATNTEMTQLKKELLVANEALVAAVGDLTATKQEEGELSLKLSGIKKQIAATEASAIAAAADVSARVGEPRVNVTGAFAPDTSMGKCKDSTASRIDSLGCSGYGVPFHFSIDAPLDVTTVGVGQEAPHVDEMVKAIVGDLKSYFQFASETNAKRCVPTATGAAIETCTPIAVA